MRENIGGVRYQTTETLDNTEEKQVTGTFGDPLPEPRPTDQGNGTKQKENSENSRFYRYRILKDFMMYGTVYRAGLTFALTDYLEDDLRKGNVELLEDKP